MFVLCECCFFFRILISCHKSHCAIITFKHWKCSSTIYWMNSCWLSSSCYYHQFSYHFFEKFSFHRYFLSFCILSSFFRSVHWMCILTVDADTMFNFLVWPFYFRKYFFFLLIVNNIYYTWTINLSVLFGGHFFLHWVTLTLIYLFSSAQTKLHNDSFIFVCQFLISFQCSLFFQVCTLKLLSIDFFSQLNRFSFNDFQFFSLLFEFRKTSFIFARLFTIFRTKFYIC